MVSAAITAACLCTAASPATAAPQDGSIVRREGDDRSKKIEAFLDGYIEGDFSSADTLFNPDATFYWADMSEAMSLDDWREAVTLQHEALRDFKMMNRVVVTTEYPDHGPWTYVWTNWQATGKPLDLPLHLMYRWDGDKIVEERTFFDVERFKGHVEATVLN